MIIIFHKGLKINYISLRYNDLIQFVFIYFNTYFIMNLGYSLQHLNTNQVEAENSN